MSITNTRVSARLLIPWIVTACAGSETEPTATADSALSTSRTSCTPVADVRTAVSTATAAVASIRAPLVLWQMDECMESRYQGPGNVNRVGCAKGQLGAAALFDGVDDRIEYPSQSSFNFATSMSVSAWVNPSRTTGVGTIVSKWYAMDSFMLAVDNGQWSFSLAFPGGDWGQSYSLKAPATAGAWTHLAASFDGWTMRLYVNGSLVDSLAVQSSSAPARALQQSTRPVTIGNHPSWNAYEGLIDEVSLYNVTLTGAEVSYLSSTKPSSRAMILVDQRLHEYLAPKLNLYRHQAEQSLGMPIGLHVVQGIDDWEYSRTLAYLNTQQSSYSSGLEGALFVGNIKLPSFYKSRNDITQIRLYPRYFEDLDGVFSKKYADNSIDPKCPTNEPHCAVNGPITVGAHDFDHTEKGKNPDPELWAAFLPVGTTGSNSYVDWAKQLDTYLDKVIRYYKGELISNGRFYMVGNDRGEDPPSWWNVWGPTRIDFYGKAGPNGEAGNACITPLGNVCYVRWPLESYATVDDFIESYDASPWVGEGWQEGSIYTQHMNSALYDVVEVNVHSWEQGSLIDSRAVRALKKSGLLVALDGCSVLGLRQPGGSNVDTSTLPSDNVAVAYLYGSSSAVAVVGDPMNRGHYAHTPTMYRVLLNKQLAKHQRYLGAAHFARMKKQYATSGTDPYALRENGMEMLVGDPFMVIP